MRLEQLGIKVLKMDESSGKIRLQMPDGHAHGWSHYDWKKRKAGEDFVNKFLLDMLFPEHGHVSVEHHKNWERMWAYCELDSFPLGVEYAYSCKRIPMVKFRVKCELSVDFQQSDVNMEIGGIISVPDSRQFFELDNERYREFLQKGWCYHNSGPMVLNHKLMILPRLVRLDNPQAMSFADEWGV